MNSISCKFHNVYKISFSDNNRANKRQIKFRILKRRYQFLSRPYRLAYTRWKITNHITLHLRNFYKTFSTKFRDMPFFTLKNSNTKRAKTPSHWQSRKDTNLEVKALHKNFKEYLKSRINH